VIRALSARRSRPAAPRLLAPALLLLPLPQAGDEPYRPPVEPASDEARAAMARFAVPEGFELELFAAEPQLANPVCFALDARGDCYVAETFRHAAGVTDMREHMDWLCEELANKTVADRVAMLRRHEGELLDEHYGSEHERVRLIRDIDGDGRADTATVFADGFNEVADGIGAGLLSYRGDVYYACMPHLWRLRDEDGDGRADLRQKLSSGYGVHVALLGHDLHGLRIGPDGRLYFSCGDRGFQVETERGLIDHTHAGAVLRCDLDGSNLEVFATGLRNPQELVFDAHGNLWTGDNNSDGGDKARWVQVVQGADSGWRFSYQHITQPDLRGPWNDEKLWLPWHEGQAAYILPPVANLADGPAGLTVDPYSDAPDGRRGHFYLCDFRGDPKISGIHSFEVVPKGAGFELGAVGRQVWGSLVTDCDFGPDGALYFSDWVFGWNKTGKGRIYRLEGPADGRDSRALLGGDWSAHSLGALRDLMAHPDLRVRQEAQFELVRRGSDGSDGSGALRECVAADREPLQRLHGVWGLGMLSRADPGALAWVRPLLDDADPEVRAQAARVLGDERDAEAAEALIAALRDASARVRMYAALALGRIGDGRTMEPLFALLRATGTSDPVLRHAGVMALAECAPEASLVKAAAHVSPDVRMGACLALRRKANPRIVAFLLDTDPLIVVEAARAIHDVPIDGALSALAGVIEMPEYLPGVLQGNALVRRVLNANNRLGGEMHATSLADFAARPGAALAHRVEALDMLADWAEPSPIDRILGDWRPLAPRDASFVPELTLELGEAMDCAPPAVAQAWIGLVRRTGASSASERLTAWVADTTRAESTRVAAFEALRELGAAGLETSVETALAAREGELRARALDALPEISIERALPVFGEVLRTGTLSERRAVYGALARTHDPRAAALLVDELGNKLRAGVLPEEVALDLVLAAERSDYPDVRQLVASCRQVRGDVQEARLARYYWSVYGGDSERGRKVFEQKAELACLRCHPRGADAAGGVGPDLRGVGRRLTRRQVLESIVLPNARIAPGYEGCLVRLQDDTVIVGRILEETAEWIRIQDADGLVLDLPLEQIDARRPDLSAMPEGHDEHLTREEMRDLIEYVCGL